MIVPRSGIDHIAQRIFAQGGIGRACVVVAGGVKTAQKQPTRCILQHCPVATAGHLRTAPGHIKAGHAGSAAKGRSPARLKASHIGQNHVVARAAQYLVSTQTTKNHVVTITSIELVAVAHPKQNVIATQALQVQLAHEPGGSCIGDRGVADLGVGLGVVAIGNQQVVVPAGCRACAADAAVCIERPVFLARHRLVALEHVTRGPVGIFQAERPAVAGRALAASVHPLVARTQDTCCVSGDFAFLHQRKAHHSLAFGQCDDSPIDLYRAVAQHGLEHARHLATQCQCDRIARVGCGVEVEVEGLGVALANSA